MSSPENSNVVTVQDKTSVAKLTGVRVWRIVDEFQDSHVGSTGTGGFVCICHGQFKSVISRFFQIVQL